MANHLLIANYSTCEKCLPVSLPVHKNVIKTSFEKLPFCKTLKELKCMKTKMEKFYKSISTSKICPSTCNVIEYKGNKMSFKIAQLHAFWLKIDDHLGRPLVQTGQKQDTISITWSYTFTSEFTDVYEEYLVYDTTGIIGSVGGTLGLFVGFSFRDVIFYLIDYLKDFINLQH